MKKQVIWSGNKKAKETKETWKRIIGDEINENRFKNENNEEMKGDAVMK